MTSVMTVTGSWVHVLSVIVDYRIDFEHTNRGHDNTHALLSL